MMDYGLFKELVPRRIMEFMPPIFHDFEPTVRPVNKVNEQKDAFCLMPPKGNPNMAVPTLYLDELYEKFAEEEDLDAVLEMAAEVFIDWSGVEMPELADFTLEKHTDRIVANLINTEMNRELLNMVPHVDFKGMSAIYRLIHTMDEQGINSAIITNDMMEGAHLTPEELQEHARHNTRRMFPFKLYDGMDDGVYVVTNEPGYFGATVMLYREEMQKLARRMGGDFFIMPTSVHEFFAIPMEGADPEELIQMLADGNDSITRPAEWLSTAIYRYVAEENQIVRVVSYAKSMKH